MFIFVKAWDENVNIITKAEQTYSGGLAVHSVLLK